MKCVSNYAYGSDGALVTVNDGGYGATRFDSVTANASAAPVYDTGTTHLSDPSVKINCGAGGVSNYLEWIGKIKGPQLDCYGRVYLRFPSFGYTGNGEVVRVLSTAFGGGSVLGLQVNNSGHMRLFGTGFAAVVGTATIPANQWVRIEYNAKAGATAQQTVKLWLSAESTGSPDETLQANSVGGFLTIDKVRLGATSGLANLLYRRAHEEFNNLTWAGPYSTGTPPVSTWYVSKNGDNDAGTSWTTAWSELDQIDWAVIAPGDTVLIDGGSTTYTSSDDYGYDFISHATNRPGINSNGMLYSTPFVIQGSGTSADHITFTTSTDSGRDGTVVIYGGRPTLLPEANTAQAGYTPAGNQGRTKGIDFTGVSYVDIIAQKRSQIMVYGCGPGDVAGTYLTGPGSGVFIHSTSHDIKIRNLEIFDCGTYGCWNRPSDGASVWKTDQEGLSLFGSANITVERCLIHDNGQDAIQGSAGDNNVIRHTWVYYRRQHSTWAGYPFNAGSQSVPDQNTTHVDGHQMYGVGLNQGPYTIDTSIAGPGVNQGWYLGNGGDTSYDDVTISNCIILAAESHGIQGDWGNSSPRGTPGTTPANWVIDHCTIHGPSTRFAGYTGDWFPVEIEGGTGHQMRHCIITWGGHVYATTPTNWDTANCVGNYYSGGTTGMPQGTNLDPDFVVELSPTNNAPTWAQYIALDLTPQASAVLAAGSGATIHSIRDLLDLIDDLNSGDATASPASVTAVAGVATPAVSGSPGWGVDWGTNWGGGVVATAARVQAVVALATPSVVAINGAAPVSVVAHVAVPEPTVRGNVVSITEYDPEFRYVTSMASLSSRRGA